MKLVFVERQKREGDTVFFIFKPKRKFLWKPGQYLFYTIPTKNPDNRGVTRYFTISSTPFEGQVSITTRIFEKPSSFKKSLMKLKKGDEIEASGPDGDFVVDDTKRNLVFIAGGIGITPFRSILMEYAHKNIKLNVQLLYANKDENIVFKEELESLKNKNSNLEINYFISPAHIDEKIINHQLASRAGGSSIVNHPIFYISGPSNFVRAIRDIVKSQGVPKENLKLDFFSGYS